MSLFSSIQTASTALGVFSTALSADQINVSNSATPGFAAIRASISPIGTPLSATDFVQLSSNGNIQADALVQAASSQASDSGTTAAQLEPVNQLFDITGTGGILAALNQFSTAFSSLAVNPNDSVERTAALSVAGNVAKAFRNTVAGLDRARSDTDSRIADTVSSINQIASQIRNLNVAIRSQATVNPGVESSLRSSLEQLSSLTGITVLKNDDGTVSVLAGGQQPLVLEDQVYRLSADPSKAEGAQVTSSGGGASPSSYSGQLGALLDFRNHDIGGLIGDGTTSGTLNDLAQGFAGRVNTLLTNGVTATGTPGIPLFTYDTINASNAARTLALDPSVNIDQLALATTGTSAVSNGVAIALGNLSSSNAAADQIDGLSAVSLFASIAAGVGARLSDARNRSGTDQTTLTAAQASRQQVSGVSLDQEAVSITGFQRSYEASAKLISILDQLTADEVGLIK